MPKSKTSLNQSMLSMALVGYELQKKKIDERIHELRARLGGRQTANEASDSSGETQPQR